MKKKLILALTVCALCLNVTGCANKDTNISNDIQNTVTENNKENTELSAEITADINLSDNITINGSNVSVDGNKVTIANAGTYNISGTLSDGQIIVDSASEENVYLVFNGVNLTCSNSAPIYVKNAKNTIIVLEDNTDNFITDGETYIFEDATTDEPNAAIFSKDDLTIKGNGSLTVTANYNNGITSKDDLKITGGTISIASKDDGLMGKDSITIKGGDITINSEGDGLKSTNAEDTEKGNIIIESGNLNITAGTDGIQAENIVNIIDGTINIVTGGGSVNSSSKSNNDTPWGSWGGSSSSTEETSSAKAIKAVNDIVIDGGLINIDSSDDSIHSNNSLTINGGTLEIASGDDGIHSDTTLEINGGDINITKSYEGIESQTITINNGTIYLVASDDGLNAAGGNDGSSTNGRPGENQFNSSSNGSITINGGYLYVDAAGDGVDSNGSIVMNDGTVIVNGPENGGNGALDYDVSFDITGGLFIAAGSSQMTQSPSSSSTQNSVNIFTSQSANTLINIKNTNGEDIITFAPSKTYQSVVISSPKLESNATYTVSVGGSSTGSSADGLYNDGSYSGGSDAGTFTTSNTVSSVGSGGGMGSPGGNRQQRW